MKYVDICYKLAELKQKQDETSEAIEQYLDPIKKAVIGETFSSVISGKSFVCSYVKFNTNTDDRAKQIVLSGLLIKNKRYESIYGHCYYPATNETTRFT